MSQYIIPHVYTSIIDKETKLTSVELARKCFDEIKAVVG